MSFLLLSKLSCQSIIIYPSIHPERSEGIPVCTCFFLRCDVACPRSFWTFWTTRSSTSGRFCCNDPHDMAAVALNQFIEYAAVMVQLSDAQDRLQICHTFADCNKIQKKHIRCEICGACPMACCGLLCCQEVFTCFHSQLAVQFPGQPRLQGSNAQPVFEPHFRAADKTNASCHPSQLGAELLLEFWWNFGALYTVFTRYTLHTLHHLVSVVSP